MAGTHRSQRSPWACLRSDTNRSSRPRRGGCRRSPIILCEHVNVHRVRLGRQDGAHADGLRVGALVIQLLRLRHHVAEASAFLSCVLVTQFRNLDTELAKQEIKRFVRMRFAGRQQRRCSPRLIQVDPLDSFLVANTVGRGSRNLLPGYSSAISLFTFRLTSRLSRNHRVCNLFI